MQYAALTRRPRSCRQTTTSRCTSPEGKTLSIDGVVQAIRDAPFASAAGAVSAVEPAVRATSDDDLADDATVAVLTPVLHTDVGVAA